jgi:hypothetical protein
MKKTISFITTKILTPILLFIAMYSFLSLFLIPSRYIKHKKIDDLNTSKLENVGWVTLKPGFKERNELPKDYSTETYNQRVAHHNGEILIQIRKK